MTLLVKQLPKPFLARMPEGPEIRRAADRLAAALVGERVEAIEFAFDRLKRFEPKLTGHRIGSVEARGKGLLIHFENRLSIFSHNQLYGRWFVRERNDFPVTNRRLRLTIHTERTSALLYSASKIEVLRPDQILAHPFLSSLGPDALNCEPDEVLQRLRSNTFAARRLGSLLLDQAFLAGLGNYLRSEILFVARVGPDRRPADCTKAELEAIARASVELTRQSYEHGGITLDLKRAARLAQERRGRGGPERHWVYGRAHALCFVCRGTILRELSENRQVFVCPECQRCR